MFQSTHPRGVRPINTVGIPPAEEVSIHAPAWGATQRYPQTCAAVNVSIHAPAWGATPYARVAASQVPVSIHAPAWGATTPASQPRLRWTGFNPRTRVGCDPARRCRRAGCRCFNPRTRVGCDLLFAPYRATAAAFQSTHPRGVRPAAGKQEVVRRACFNPRTRVGCDSWSFTISRSEPEFQSTHPRGVRQGCRLKERYDGSVSIHAPAWGATDAALRGLESIWVSIHAPAWGATYRRLTTIPFQDWFQSTHPRGVRRPAAAGIWPGESFNPRTRVGCDAATRASNSAASWFQSTHPRGVRLLHGDRGALGVLVSIHAPAWGATAAPGMER